MFPPHESSPSSPPSPICLGAGPPPPPDCALPLSVALSAAAAAAAAAAVPADIPPPPLSLPPAAAVAAAAAAAAAATHTHAAAIFSPRAPQHVSFTLPAPLFAWLESMALVHNYGSVHKSVRDLLAWAIDSQQDDLDWLFTTPHAIPLDLQPAAPFVPDAAASCIAEKQPCSRALSSDGVTLDARLSDHVYAWIWRLVRRYSLRGPSDVLRAVCTCAIELGAADDVFESDECGHDLPESTAELYHDLGISCFVLSSSSSAATFASSFARN